MNSRQLFSLYLEPAVRPEPRYRAIKRPRSPYLSQVRPVSLEPVRAALEEDPPRLAPASSAIGVVEKVWLGLMVFIAIAFGIAMTPSVTNLPAGRKQASLGRDLQRAQAELAAANLARRDLAAALAERVARDSEPAVVRAAFGPLPARRVVTHH